MHQRRLLLTSTTNRYLFIVLLHCLSLSNLKLARLACVEHNHTCARRVARVANLVGSGRLVSRNVPLDGGVATLLYVTVEPSWNGDVMAVAVPIKSKMKKISIHLTILLMNVQIPPNCYYKPHSHDCLSFVLDPIVFLSP